VSAVASEEEGRAAGQTTADRIPRDRPLGVIHSGGRYLFGFGPDSYGIWDAANEGPPVEEFPPTKEGRLSGWRRYMELEPSVQTIPVEQHPVREEVEEVETRSRRGGLLIGGGIALLLVIGLIVFALTRSSSTGPGGGGGSEVTGPKTTHMDITGSMTLSEDLKQKTFSPPGQGFTRHMIATWAGAQTKLKFDFDDPTPGDYTTGQLPRLRRLDFTFTPTSPSSTPSGASSTPTGSPSPVTITSVGGECQVKVNNADSNALSGSYTCTGLKIPGSDQTVDIKGTFFAKP
jgi:hypothetical protein